VKSERAAGLIVALVICAVIGIVWATRGLMGVFWGAVSIAAIWIVYWTASHFLLEPSRLRSWLRGQGQRGRDH
jgi:type IV secretory pathway VirB2 component (pilin)